MAIASLVSHAHSDWMSIVEEDLELDVPLLSYIQCTKRYNYSLNLIIFALALPSYKVTILKVPVHHRPSPPTTVHILMIMLL